MIRTVLGSPHSVYNAAGVGSHSAQSFDLEAGDFLRVSIASRSDEDGYLTDSVEWDGVPLTLIVSNQVEIGPGDYAVVEEWALFDAVAGSGHIQIVPGPGTTIVVNCTAEKFTGITGTEADDVATDLDAEDPVEITGGIDTVALDTVLFVALVSVQPQSESPGSWQHHLINGQRIGSQGHADDVTLSTAYLGVAAAANYAISKNGVNDVAWAIVAWSLEIVPPTIGTPIIADTIQESDVPVVVNLKDSQDPAAVVPDPGGPGDPGSEGTHPLGQTDESIKIRTTQKIGKDVSVGPIVTNRLDGTTGMVAQRATTTTGPVRK